MNLSPARRVASRCRGGLAWHRAILLPASSRLHASRYSTPYAWKQVEGRRTRTRTPSVRAGYPSCRQRRCRVSPSPPRPRGGPGRRHAPPRRVHGAVVWRTAIGPGDTRGLLGVDSRPVRRYPSTVDVHHEATLLLLYFLSRFAVVGRGSRNWQPVGVPVLARHGGATPATPSSRCASGVQSGVSAT